MFITLERASFLYDLPKRHFLNLFHEDKKHGRDDRFIIENGVIKIHEDYLYPHRREIEELYIQALETTHGIEKDIAKVIAKKTGKGIHTVYMNLRNFKFKNYLDAKEVIAILKEFIRNNNLFYRGVA